MRSPSSWRAGARTCSFCGSARWTEYLGEVHIVPRRGSHSTSARLTSGGGHSSLRAVWLNASAICNHICNHICNNHICNHICNHILQAVRLNASAIFAKSVFKNARGHTGLYDHAALEFSPLWVGGGAAPPSRPGRRGGLCHVHGGPFPFVIVRRGLSSPHL